MLLLGVILTPSSGTLAAKRPPRELPAPVAVRDLVERPAEYDGRRVIANGFVRSIELQQGRRGSEYVVLVLEDAAADAPESVFSVTVVSLSVVSFRKCDRALVQGVYHREGKQAGRPYEHFIDAEAVLPGEGDEQGYVPRDCEKKV